MPDLRNGFAGDYVANIPWESHPLFWFNKNKEEYVQSLQNLFNNKPELNLLVDFNDDLWDFNPYYHGINDAALRISFRGFDEPVKTYAKFYAMHEMFYSVKISTFHLSISYLKSCFSRISSQSPRKAFPVIATQDFIDLVEDTEATHSHKSAVYRALGSFYRFVIQNYHLELPVNPNKLDELSRIEGEKGREIDPRTPNMPEAYYQAIKEKAKEVMRNPDAGHNDRSVACMLILFSQLGLRIGDLVLLEEDELRVTELKNQPLKVYYLHYKTKKNSRDYDNLNTFDVVANNLTVEAFQTLVELSKAVPKKFRKKFIVTLKPRQPDPRDDYDKYPLQVYQVKMDIKRFFVKYLDRECHQEWDGIEPTINNLTIKEVEPLYIPKPVQFRVYVATYYYNHHVPLTYIQRYFGHLADFMRGYYVRPKEDFLSDYQKAEEVIRSIVVDNATPIGYMGEELKNRIMKFIDECDSITVASSVDDILKALGDRIIIRAKFGGCCCCIKTTFMGCPYDAMSNEILCASGNCINIYHFYYEADITYHNFQILCHTCNHALAIGKKRVWESELVKLKDLSKNILLPQLDELAAEVRRKGEESIIEKYPSMEMIIRNEDAIRNEVKEWMNK